MSKRFFLAVILILGLSLSANAAIDTVYLEGVASNLNAIPIGLTEFDADAAIIKSFKEKPIKTFERDLSISGRFAPIISEKLDIEEFTKEGASYFLHGKIDKLGDGRLLIECRLTVTQSGKLVIGQTYTVKKAGVRKAFHNFSDLITEMLWGDQGSASTHLTYVSKINNHKQIIVSDYDGFNPWQLTKGSAINTMPVWHPNNKSVYFISFRGSTSGIYHRNLYTGKTKHLFGSLGQAFAPSISPTGESIVFTVAKGGSSDVYKGAINGSKTERLTYHWAVETSASWSPNGTEILYSSDRSGAPQIYVMDSDGNDQRRITYMGRYNESAVWSPKGDRIAYVSMDAEGFNIYTCGLDGTDVTQLTSNSGNNENPTWSPDGAMIAFSSNRSGRPQIYIMRADGSGVTQITTRGSNTLPNWSGFNNKEQGVKNESN